jgi:hypothetical protein
MPNAYVPVMNMLATMMENSFYNACSPLLYLPSTHYFNETAQELQDLQSNATFISQQHLTLWTISSF